MAVKLRLSRMGRKKRPFYRIVAIDSRKRRDGAYIEKVGYYDPLTRPATLEIDHDLALKWLNVGATPSDTVRSLFRRDGVMLRWDMSKRDYDQVAIEEAVKAHREKKLSKLRDKEKKAMPAEPEPKEEPKEEPKVEAAPEGKADAGDKGEETKPADEKDEKSAGAEEAAAEEKSESAEEKADDKKE